MISCISQMCYLDVLKKGRNAIRIHGEMQVNHRKFPESEITLFADSREVLTELASMTVFAEDGHPNEPKNISSLIETGSADGYAIFWPKTDEAPELFAVSAFISDHAWQELSQRIRLPLPKIIVQFYCDRNYEIDQTLQSVTSVWSPSVTLKFESVQ